MNHSSRSLSGWRLHEGDWLLEEEPAAARNGDTGCLGWILIVDDQPTRREALANVLTGEDYVAWFAEDLDQARETLRQADVFSAVILSLALTRIERTRFAAWLGRTQRDCRLICSAAGDDWQVQLTAPELRLIHCAADTKAQPACVDDLNAKGEGVTG